MVPSMSAHEDIDVHDHLLWLASGGCSPRTIYERGRLLAHLIAHAGQPAVELDSSAVTAWLDRAQSPGTRSAYFGSVRSFFRWAVLAKRVLDDPTALMRRPHLPRRLPRPLSAADLARTLAVASPHATTMVLLGFYGGLRACEIAEFQGEWLNPRTRLMRVVGKGRNERSIPVHPLILARAPLYPTEGFWFRSPSLGREHEDPSSVSRLISATMRRAGVQATGHQLRHAFGTNVHRVARDLRVTQELLGHRYPSTTAIYTQVAMVDMEQAVLGLPGLL